jgi:hypothetical protein
MSYMILSGRCCYIIILNFHAPREDKIGDMMDRLCEELELNAKVVKENIFKSTILNDNLHEIRNNNRVRVVNFATSKNLSSKVERSHIVTFVNVLRHLLVEKFSVKFTIFLQIGDGIQV